MRGAPRPQPRSPRSLSHNLHGGNDTRTELSRTFSLWVLSFDTISRPVASATSCCHAHALELVVFLPLHPPVLEPDLDLPLREAEGMGDLDPPSARQVPVEVKLFLQLQGLVPGVRSSRPLPFWTRHI